MPATPFPEKLKELVAEKGTSISRLYDDAKWTGDGQKPSKAQLDKAMTGQRPLNMAAIEMLAQALGVEPGEFAEYRLASARAQLDEREVGLDAALEVLSRIETALASSPRARRASEADRQARSQTPTPAVRLAPKNRRAGGGRRNA